ncbi:MAG: GlsB/YeaQ/YmgE family stress response membrane protein [Acidimicrobiales bacterium]
MFDFGTWVYLIVVGLVIGYVARLIVPGEDPMTWWQTMLLGIVGSLVGGFLGYILFGFDEDEGFLQPGGIIGSLIGAIVALLVWRAIKSRRGGARAA